MELTHYMRIVQSGSNTRLEVKTELRNQLVQAEFDVRPSKESNLEVKVIFDTEAKTLRLEWPKK